MKTLKNAAVNTTADANIPASLVAAVAAALKSKTVPVHAGLLPGVAGEYTYLPNVTGDDARHTPATLAAVAAINGAAKPSRDAAQLAFRAHKSAVLAELLLPAVGKLAFGGFTPAK